MIASDMPVGLVVPDGEVAQEGIANRIPGHPLDRELEVARLLSDLERHSVRNVVRLTADAGGGHHSRVSPDALTSSAT